MIKHHYLSSILGPATSEGTPHQGDDADHVLSVGP
jgi:hypothetical protein